MISGYLMNLTLEGAADIVDVELDELTVQLRANLLELDVDNVELLRSQEAPAGSKPSEVITIGALAITLSPIALRGVLQLVDNWLKTRPIRRVRVVIGDNTIDLAQASPQQQERLIDAFIAAHQSASGAELGDDSPSPALSHTYPSDE